MSKTLRLKYKVFITGILLVIQTFADQAGPESLNPADIKEAENFLRSFSESGHNEKRQDYSQLFENLADKKWAVREQATRSLINAGPGLLDHLGKILNSPDPEVATRARRIRDQINARERSRIPIEPSAKVQKSALLLARSGNRHTPQYLFPLLSHENKAMREAAAGSLRRITRKNFGYHVDDSQELRTQSINRWQEWWAKEKAVWKYLPEEETALLVCDPASNQILAVDLDGELLWKRKMKFSPMVAEVNEKGNLVVAYRSKGIVQEINPAGGVLWTYDGTGIIKGIFDIQLLTNGNLLLTDDPGNQVVEINRKGEVVWGIKNLPAPHAAWRTPDGNTHIAVHKESVILSINSKGEILSRIEEQNSVTDLRPFRDGTSWIVTRMGLTPQVAVREPDGSETKLYTSGLPVTSGLLTDEGLVFSVNERQGVVRGLPGDSLRPIGISRNHMWGKIRTTSKREALLAAPAP